MPFEIKKFSDVCKITGGFAFKSKDYKKSGIPIIRISNIKDNGIVIDEKTVYCSDKEYQNCKEYEIENGAVLIALSGATTGKFGKYKLKQKGLLNQRVAKLLSVDKNSSLDFYYYYLHLLKDKILKDAYGMAQPNISIKELNDFDVPVPPLPTQQKIVDKIESLFSKIDSGNTSLQKAKALLEQYRQSVLKSAFEGKLTAQWREEYKGELEPASELLERIREERKKKLGKKYKELPPVDTSELPELPEGWCWCRLGELIETIQAGKSFRCEERPPKKKEVGVVKVSSVTWGEFDEEESKTCTDSAKINNDYFINGGDFLFSRANTIELVGACVITKKVNLSLMLSDKILRIIYSKKINFWYALYYLRSWLGRKEIESLATGNQNSMRNIGQDRIRSIRIPIPSTSEQNEIVGLVEKFLLKKSLVENEIERRTKSIISLKQSVLKSAFEGKLIEN